MTIKSRVASRLIQAGLTVFLLSLPAYAKTQQAPPLPLQQSLQRFLKSHTGRLLEIEYEYKAKLPYYRVTFLDAKGVLQHLRILEKGQESINQAGKPAPQLTGNLLTLQQILNKTFGKQVVRLLEAELKPDKKGGYHYELEWIDSQGIAWEGTYDARTGRQLSRKRD